MTTVSLVKINNIMGIESLEFTPDGKLTLISGDNGLGKTSILEAIKSVSGGHDATLLRKGAKEGEVVLVLDDGREVHHKITADKSTKSVYQADGKKVPSPGGAIKALIEASSANPVEFLTASKKDRVKVLLDSMPIHIDMERLSKMAGYEVKVPDGMASLDILAYVHKQIFDDRTGTNRAVKEKDNSINQLTLALPEVPEGVEVDEDKLRAQIEAARGVAQAENERIAGKIDGIRKDNQARIDTLKAEAQAAIDKIRADCQASVDAINAELAEWELKAANQKDLTRQRFDAAVAPMNDTLAIIKSNRDMFAKRQQSEETIKAFKGELETLEKDAAAQTQALSAIEAYKSELISNLPIPGLEVVNGEVMRDGIVFDRLNTAQQVDIAIEIAKLRAGELAIACVDNFEALSETTFREFRERAAESNLQLFVTRVTELPLAVG